MKKILFILLFAAIAAFSAHAQKGKVGIRPPDGGTVVRRSNDNMVSNFDPTFAVAPLRLNDVCFDRRRGSLYRYNGTSWSLFFGRDDGQQADIAYSVTNPASNILTGWDPDLYNKATINYTTAGVDTFYIDTIIFAGAVIPGEIFVIDFNTSSRTTDADTVLVHFNPLWKTYDNQPLPEWKVPPRGRVHMAFRLQISVEGGSLVEVDDILGSYGHSSGGGGSTPCVDSLYAVDSMLIHRNIDCSLDTVTITYNPADTAYVSGVYIIICHSGIDCDTLTPNTAVPGGTFYQRFGTYESISATPSFRRQPIIIDVFGGAALTAVGLTGTAGTYNAASKDAFSTVYDAVQAIDNNLSSHFPAASATNPYLIRVYGTTVEPAGVAIALPSHVFVQIQDGAQITKTASSNTSLFNISSKTNCGISQINSGHVGIAYDGGGFATSCVNASSSTAYLMNVNITFTNTPVNASALSISGTGGFFRNCKAAISTGTGSSGARRGILIGSGGSSATCTLVNCEGSTSSAGSGSANYGIHISNGGGEVELYNCVGRSDGTAALSGGLFLGQSVGVKRIFDSKFFNSSTGPAAVISNNTLDPALAFINNSYFESLATSHNVLERDASSPTITLRMHTSAVNSRGGVAPFDATLVPQAATMVGSNATY